VRGGLALLLSVVLGSAGCSTGKVAEKRAFFEAGHEVKLRQPPPTNAELKRDLDLFLENDLLFTFDKAKAREAKEVSALRIVFVGGMALGVVGATAGSLKGNSGARAALMGTGVAAMAGSAIRYFTATKDLGECQEFLSRRGAGLRAWGTQKLDGSDARVSAGTWREYADLVGETQLHDTCLVVR